MALQGSAVFRVFGLGLMRTGLGHYRIPLMWTFWGAPLLILHEKVLSKGLSLMLVPRIPARTSGFSQASSGFKVVQNGFCRAA